MDPISYFYVSTGGTTFTVKTCPLDSEEDPHRLPNGGMVMKYTFSTDVITTIVTPSYNFPGIWLGGAWDFRMEVNPANANNLFYGSVQVFQSTDGGSNWQIINTPHVDQHDYKWQAGTNRIWFADDGGLSYTTNNGTTWTNIKSLPIIQLSSVRSSNTAATS
ncbi:MAG: hypothetical protein IPN89_15500 [Saprospiraceae bacterium]|nr:hypothetical protein [Saprospiraceae bacterium]